MYVSRQSLGPANNTVLTTAIPRRSIMHGAQPQTVTRGHCESHLTYPSMTSAANIASAGFADSQVPEVPHHCISNVSKQLDT